jgi:hypothetical protein
MLAADSVAINRLQIKGDKRTSQALVRELEQTSWTKPLPAHLQSAWILVRELKVTGKARDLREQTAQHLDAELQHAVRAIHGDPAASNVIWFATLTELIAFLSVDLALGKTTHWYWSRWVHLLKYPRHDAMVRLLCEHIEHLPAIIMQLHQQQQLALVFNQLSESGAKTLVRELARVCGFPAPASWQTQTTITDVVVQDIYQALTAQISLLSWWQPLVCGLNSQDGRVMLVTALHGLIYTPLWLQQQPSVLVSAVASIVTAMPNGVSQEVADKKDTRGDTNAERVIKQFSKTDKPYDQLSGSIKENTAVAQASNLTGKKNELLPPEAHRAESIGRESNSSDDSLISSSFHNPHELKSEQVVHPLGKIHSVDSASMMDDTGDVAAEAAIVNQPEGYQFITGAGGFFYLLNPLRLLLTQERLAAQTEASVWYWLLDLYRVFVRTFPTLDDVMDDPLRNFMLQQLRPEATHHELQALAIQMMSSPPSEFATQLFEDLREHYQHTSFWQELNNAEGFFATPARVIASASHWDIYFPLSSVRLDVRLVGWDINPGWLPWLGRVVAFHYVETPIRTKQEDSHYES